MRSSGLFLLLAFLAMGACDKAVREPKTKPVPSAPEPTAAPTYESSLFDLDAGELAAARAYLKSKVDDIRDTIEDDDRKPVFRAAKVDLDGDGTREVLLRIESNQFCGSGGCGLDVLKLENGRYRRVSHTTLTFLPIGSPGSQTNGWDDLIVTVRRDYAPSGAVRLIFDGKTYSPDPAMPVDGDFFVVLLSETSQPHPLLD
jgi:hypothetical protein